MGGAHEGGGARHSGDCAGWGVEAAWDAVGVLCGGREFGGGRENEEGVNAVRAQDSDCVNLCDKTSYWSVNSAIGNVPWRAGGKVLWWEIAKNVDMWAPAGVASAVRKEVTR